MGKQQLVFIHDNAPVHRSVLVMDFFSKKTMWQHNHSPDLNSVDLYMFLWLNSSMRLRRVRNITDIIKNATEELKRLLQNDFQECILHFYSSWQNNIVAQGDNFERNLP